ncbi:MAG TPA: response regulator transcription factor [Acidimicrobiales bacterium]|nr:response regulator transcription factor [Acidimicrobiales bacterium]
MPVVDDLRRILVVDDDPYIADLVSATLRFEGFEVQVVGTGRDALTAASTTRHDLVVLDVMLPDMEGTEVCRRLRADGAQLPVLFLTARDSTEDKVAGLTVGGDDYVTKPFSLEELIARIRALLRRTGGIAATQGRLEFADLVLDEDTFEVWRQGNPIEFTPTEFNLLRFLMSNARRVMSKSQILDHVWHYDFGGDPNIVETYISYLRKKLDRYDPPLIHTIRGVGYTLRLPH